MALAELPAQVPADAARYHLYVFKHSHEGDYMESHGMIPNKRFLGADLFDSFRVVFATLPVPLTPEINNLS
jgi:hypothetical protein